MVQPCAAKVVSLTNWSEGGRVGVVLEILICPLQMASLMYVNEEKRRGPSTDPCGTPTDTTGTHTQA